MRITSFIQSLEDYQKSLTKIIKREKTKQK